MKRKFFCALFLFFLFLLPGAFCVAEEVSLTEEEKLWLKSHAKSFILAPTPNYPPIDFFDENGKHSGVAADILRLVEQRTGVKFELKKLDSWNRILEEAKSLKIDATTIAQKTPERQKFWLFTEPYVDAPTVIITRQETTVKLKLDSLQNLKVGLVKGYAIDEFLAEHHPYLKTIPVENDLTGLQKVALGELDAMIADLPTASYLISKWGISNLHIGGQTGHRYRYSLAVRKDFPILKRIIDKGLASISEVERKQIYDKWIRLGIGPFYLAKTFWIIILSILSFLLLAVLIFYIWNRSLKIIVARQTRDLSIAHARLSQIMNASTQVAIIAIDEAGVIQLFNVGAELMYGYSAEEMIGKEKVTKLHLESEIEERSKQLENELGIPVSGHEVFIAKPATKGGYEQSEWTCLTKNGQKIVISLGVSIIKDEQGKIIGFLGVASDITQRKQTEIQLEQSEENLRITVNSIGDAVVSTDTEGRIQRINPVASRLTGWKEEDAVGRRFEEVFSLIDSETRKRMENPVSEVIETGQKKELPNNSILVARDGKEYRVADSGAPILDADKKINGVVLVFRDVTEELTLQERLHQSQKMEAIGQLAGGIAHDFNNMLSGIIGASELLPPYLKEEKNGIKYLELIKDASDRAAGLVKNLLAFARKRSLSITPVDVHKVLRDTVMLLKSTSDRRIEFDLKLDSRECIVMGEESQLQSAFVNLGINAVQAMSDGGEFLIRTHFKEVDESYCRNSSFEIEPGHYMEIEFVDNGAGISKECLPHIFEPFFTTKKQGKGTGLGLAAVFGTVQSHKGEITAESKLGKGTCIKIILPLVELAVRMPEESADERKGSGKILIIDDELLIRETTSNLLQKMGFDIEVAENGRVGLEIFKKAPESFKLVLLDMIMPVMNGKDCFYGLKSIDPDAKILVISGFSKDNDVEEMLQDGLRGFIQKPFGFTDLSNKIFEIVN